MEQSKKGIPGSSPGIIFPDDNKITCALLSGAGLYIWKKFTRKSQEAETFQAGISVPGG
jgi:hypothetical protein